MHASLGFPLTLDHVRSSPAAALLADIRLWLQRENPTCLMHPHGFYVVLLGRSELEEWRFHFWPKGQRKLTGMPAFIHTHDRHVESRILQGRLTNITYELEKREIDGQPLYEVAYGGDRYVSDTKNFLRRTAGRVRPVEREREILHCGGAYHVERHTYHEAQVPPGLAACTLVCMHHQKPGAVMLVGMDGYPAEIEIKRAEHRASSFLAQLDLEDS